MSKKDWTDELRLKMDNYGEATPDSTGKAVEAAAIAISRKAARRRRARIAGAFMSAAAVLAVAFLAFSPLNKPEVSQQAVWLAEREEGVQIMEKEVPDNIDRTADLIAEVSGAVKNNNAIGRTDSFEDKAENIASAGQARKQDAEEKDGSLANDDSEKIEPAVPEINAESSKGDADESTNSYSKHESPGQREQESGMSWEQFERQIAHEKSRKRGRGLFAFNFSASGTPGASSSGSGTAIASQMNSLAYEDEDYPALLTKASSGEPGIMRLQNETSYSSISHYQPVTVGLTFSWSFSKRFALETGVNYSFLYSESTNGSEDSYYETAQTLHFIGIPLKLRADIWHPGKWNIYLGAGGEVQKCIAGSTVTSYILAGNTLSSGRESLNIEPCFWSVAANLGLSYDFSRFIALYLEPGLSYHFAPSSDYPANAIEPIYSSRPLNFRLSLGLRFNL